jgi:ribonuclease VapC
MIIDTSAIIAILYGEPDGEELLERLVAAPRRAMSTTNLVEAWLVVDRNPNRAKAAALDELISLLQIEAIPVTLNHARLAREAYNVYGKGKHPAALNFGDCFSYALAKSSGESLLYKGNDFAQTDVATR